MLIVYEVSILLRQANAFITYSAFMKYQYFYAVLIFRLCDVYLFICSTDHCLLHDDMFNVFSIPRVGNVNESLCILDDRGIGIFITFYTVFQGKDIFPM